MHFYFQDISTIYYSFFIDLIEQCYSTFVVLWNLLLEILYNICTLSENITFTCAGFKNRQRSESVVSLCPVSQREQMNVIFSENVHVLCLSCNLKKNCIMQQQNFTKRTETSALPIIINGVLFSSPRSTVRSMRIRCYICVFTRRIKLTYTCLYTFIVR